MLVREGLREGTADAVPSSFPWGAGLFDQLSRRAWVLIDDGVVSRFGAALAWVLTRSCVRADFLVEGSPTAPGVIARRAGLLPRGLDLRVWSVSGRAVVPASASAVGSGPSGSPPAELVELLERHGLEVVWEHGVLRGEVLGLEVARTVGDRLEVGVGRHDRSARLDMRPGEDVESALEEAAAAVRSLRREGAPPHPANLLARSRWLRAVVLASPSRFGCSALRAVEPPEPWFDLPESGAAPAVGTTAQGEPVVVVCSVGVDLDVVPTAVDCRSIHGRGELRILMPSTDVLPVHRAMAELAVPPVSLVPLPPGWQSM